MTKLSASKTAIAVSLLCAVSAIACHAQTFTSLESFHGREGGQPWVMSLIQGRDGNFYGTTMGGQPHCQHFSGCGTVFKMTPGGTLTTIYSFCSQTNCSDGAYPEAGLLLATDGNLYGTTWAGGVGVGYGTAFKITPDGKLTTLHSFCSQTECADGSYPTAGLIQGIDGNLYGTTYENYESWGTIFKISPTGALTTLHTFDGADGAHPYASLVQGSDGNLYGGAGDTIFKMTTTGTLTVLYKVIDTTTNFDSRLVQATDGNFYGTDSTGGANEYGRVFKMTPRGELTTLYSFCSQTDCSDGYYPSGGVTQATDGNFYGVTSAGGSPSCVVNGGAGCGTIFQLTPAGTLTTLHSFDQSDGIVPLGGLLQATNGTLYGTTDQGGDITCSLKTGCGTVFSIDMGLSPFVSFVLGAGKVGQTGQILGQGFTGSTAVYFNGIPASFTVRSDTYLTAPVPPGAITGYVTVTTPSGTLKSNMPFFVIE
jgi:uncharacterized repeat protein (TIGR03803 family)